MNRIWKKIRKGLASFLRFLKHNDVVLKIYASFVIVLVLTGVLTSLIFIRLYQRNYIASHTKLLTNQGKRIAKRVRGFEKNQNQKQFERYQVYIDELEHADSTDVWIVANQNAGVPLQESFVNAYLEDDSVSENTLEAVNKTFEKGKVFHNSEYDDVYGTVTLSVSVPIKNTSTGEVSGAVLLVSMINKQTMGIDDGKYMIVLSVVFSVIIALIVAVVFSSNLSKSILRLSNHISVLARGDYRTIEVKKPHSQIGLLEQSLGRLSKKLKKANEEREQLEQVRRDFFANVSHELRTPITVIRGYTETLSDGVIKEQSKVEELYGRMLLECQGIERLVEDLFILSKMQNPDFQIEKEPVSLKQIFDDIRRSVYELGKEKGIQWQLEMPEGDELCLILGDYGRLRQMFFIILDNAIKFSQENGVIEIQVKKEEEHFQVCIRDHGVGIKKEELPYIFEKFYTSKMRQNTKGTGLGLMIARGIALKHGSDIRVESRENEGSAFFFLFDECTAPEEFE